MAEVNRIRVCLKGKPMMGRNVWRQGYSGFFLFSLLPVHNTILMKRPTLFLLLLSIAWLYCAARLSAQGGQSKLLGYWHNWNDVNAPYIPLNLVDPRYDVVIVAFAIPEFGTDYKMSFQPDQGSTALFQSQVQTLQAQGKQVLISIGGATAPVSLDNAMERDTFVSTMLDILNIYGFDGVDIDLEGASLLLSGGNISSPIDSPIVNLITAVRQIMTTYQSQFQKRMVLTMAPETAYVQGGMSGYGGIWGAYLPVIHALRDSLDVLMVQLYNSGSMYGIDQQVYTQGTADFIVAMSEALITGFQTAGGYFAGLPAQKIAVGLPACPLAAGGGYTDTATVKAALSYLRGEGPKPGNYSLSLAGGYPEVNKMMTWSINWDALASCGGSYAYAENFDRIFPDSLTTGWTDKGQAAFHIYPNPATDRISISLPGEGQATMLFHLYDATGRLLRKEVISAPHHTLDVAHLPPGHYLLQVKGAGFETQKWLVKRD